MKSGIYKIQNQINGKCYIGCSCNIGKRWTAHKHTGNNPEKRDYPLYRAFRKYGIENFSFEIIEECLPEQFPERERYWIKYYDSFFNGYNQNFGGDSGLTKPKEVVIGVMNDLKNTDMYHYQIAEKWGMSVEMVQGINTGRYWLHDDDYPLQKVHQPGIRTIYYCKDCGKIITPRSIRCHNCDLAFRRKNRILNESLREELKRKIRFMSFDQVGKDYNVSGTTIHRWCEKLKIPKSRKEIKSYSDEEWEKV